METVTYKIIGTIHSPFCEPKGTPIQPTAAKGIDGTVELFPEYVEGLSDLTGISHVFLIYHLHLAQAKSLMVKPFLDDVNRGVFATRSPSRPNTIGISVVRLLDIQGNILHIQEVDIIDGTPLLDIKPYVPEFDVRDSTAIGWYEKRIDRLPVVKDDGRFTA